VTIRAEAARIVAAIQDAARVDLRADPVGALRAHFGLRVEEVPVLAASRGGGGWCDGLSLLEDNTLLYAPTINSRRENFTVLHELGHFLIEHDDDALDWIGEQDNPTRVIEQLCDEIAAALLIPPDLVDQIVGAGPVCAQDLLDLFLESQASQVVCVKALARRMGSAGAVFLTDRASQTVVWAEVVGDAKIRPHYNQTLPAGHPLRRIQPGQSIRAESFWEAPWGDRHPYYLDAVATSKRAYAILSVDDLWRIAAFHPGGATPPEDARPTESRRCQCGYAGKMSGWPCDDCGHNYCPRCKECDCPRRNAAFIVCSRCTLSVPRADIRDGRCSECR
jgi:Zn-dependent peptidase ImmA (M78 family)